MSLRINSDFNGVTDPDAGAYIAAVEAADGNQLLEFAVGKAINDFVVGCKADGIWSAIKASCILAGARTLNGALVPLAGTAPTNNNFVSGDYNRKTGLVGNGSTKYLDSNRNNSADPQNSKHIAVYFGELLANPAAFSCHIGRVPVDGVTGATLISTDSGSSSNRYRVNGSTAAVVASGTSAGFKGALRASSVEIVTRHGASNTTTASASQSPDNGNLFVFARNTVGTPDSFSGARLAFYSIGEAIDLQKLDSRVTALINAFGAAIP